MKLARSLVIIPILGALTLSLSSLSHYQCATTKDARSGDLPAASVLGISEDLRKIIIKNGAGLEEFRAKMFVSPTDQQISAYMAARKWQKQNVAATSESLAEPFSLFMQAGQHPEIGNLARLQGAELALVANDEAKIQEILSPIFLRVKKYQAASQGQNAKPSQLAQKKLLSEGVYRLAESYFRTDQLDKANEAFDLVQNVFPDTAFAKGSLYYIAEIASVRGRDPKEVLDAYVTYIKAAPDGKNAIVAAQKILDRGEPPAEAYAALARVYFVNNNWQRALEYYKKTGVPNIQEAVCLVKLKQKDQAVNSFFNYLNTGTNFASVTTVATQLAKPLTKAEALDLWKKVLNSKATAEAKQDALWNVALRSTSQEAIPYYQKILATYPTCQYAPESQWWVTWNQIKTAGSDKSKLEAALASCHKALKLYGGTDYASKYYYWSGKIHELLKTPEQKNLAIAAYKTTQAKFGGTYYGYRAAQRLNALAGKPDRHWQIHPGRNEPNQSWNWPESNDLFDWTSVQNQVGSIPVILAAIGDYDECLNQIPDNAPKPFKAWLYLKSGKVIKALNAVSLPLEGKPIDAQSPTWRMAYPLAYGEHIEKESQKNSMDPLLVHALIRQESRYEPTALSRSKAMGLMQLLLGTAQGVAKHNGIALSSNAQVFEPPTNIALGTAYLNYVLKRHNGNAMLAVASYNGGPNAAAKWMREFQATGGGDQEYLVENIPFQETRDYVRKVFANYWTYENIYLKRQVD
ncbi:transglycosylase SLT domain-containing protein [bacterium]|nr:transglycosylase SLT domain-containing protein [bacterium]QQR56132.1 MAG: transglycosylase SLT domain-containing protein [Candidatus Melainabacteria bacterium]